VSEVALLTRKEVASLLRIHPATVSRLIHAGRLQAYRIGRGIRIARSSVVAYLASTVPSTSAV
jgi:excisionase family DNA binding protein